MFYIKQIYKIHKNKPYLFIGSKIRGLLGYSLKDEVCINPSFKCDGCFATKECIFYEMYEKQNSTHHYRLDFNLYENKYKFSLLLFGELQKHKDVVSKAMLVALKEYKDVNYKEKTKKLKLKKRVPQKLKIIFETPLRIKKNNRFATRNIELLDILLSIHRRYLELQNKNYEKIDIDIEYKVEKKLHFKELVRRSNKQNTKMNMGGLMGELIVESISKESYRLLKIGEIIGVGKNCVFGLGKIKVEVMDE